MDAWMLHRVWGLPLRMVFLCSWHRRHATLIAAGVPAGLLGYDLSQPWLVTMAIITTGPSILCLTSLPFLAILFMGLGKLFSAEDDS
jgi:hypothetical protein